MAFDRPLEADRVDNLSLLSSFVRAPILGPVMWVLGKNILPGETDKVENKNNNDAHQLIDDVSPVKTTSSLMRKNSFTLQNSNERYPDLAGTSISDIVNDSSIDEMDGKNSNNNNIHIRRSFVMNNEEAKLNDPLSHPLQKLKKKTRKMSWSDESGQSLVEYYDMSQSSSPHTNNTPPLQSFPSRKPIKSAMKKSSGSYGMKQGGKAPLHPSQCIPSGMDGGSIVMPSGGGYQQPQQHQLQLQHQQPHHAGANGANGYISPQYGWYISMTPPTPPHFHESSSNSDGNNKNDESYNNTQYQTLQQQYHFHNPKNKGNGFSTQNEQLLPPLQQYQQSSLTQTSINNKNIGKFPKAGQDAIAARPIFTRSLKGVPNNTSGWPSVPL